MDNYGMTEEYDIEAMRDRLTKALKEKGKDLKTASLASGLSKGYLHSILVEKRAPTVPKLAQVCSANGLSLSYIMFGFDVSPETEKLMMLMEKDPQTRDHVLGLLTARTA